MALKAIKRGTDWGQEYYDRYLKDAASQGITPIDRAQFDVNVGESQGGFEPSYANFMKTQYQQRDSNKKISDTAARNKALAEALIGRRTSEMSANRSKLAAALTRQAEENFRLNQPGILEDLSSRGLLHSSGVGEALATEKGNQVRNMNNILQVAAANDDSAIGALETAALEGETGLNLSGLQRNFSLEDYMNQMNQANEMAKQERSSREKIANQQMWGDLLKTGVSAYTGMPAK